jgi:hypothetical protein
MKMEGSRMIDRTEDGTLSIGGGSAVVTRYIRKLARIGDRKFVRIGFRKLARIGVRKGARIEI